jgi:hypothetical protein
MEADWGLAEHSNIPTFKSSPLLRFQPTPGDWPISIFSIVGFDRRRALC